MAEKLKKFDLLNYNRSRGSSSNNSRSNSNYSSINESMSNNNNKFSVLIASSNQEKLQNIVEVFRLFGFLVKTASNATQVIKIVE